MLEDVSSDTYHGKCMQSPATIATITGLGEAKLRLVLRTLQSIIEVLMAPVFDDGELRGKKTSSSWNKRVSFAYRKVT